MRWIAILDDAEGGVQYRIQRILIFHIGRDGVQISSLVLPEKSAPTPWPFIKYALHEFLD